MQKKFIATVMSTHPQISRNDVTQNFITHQHKQTKFYKKKTRLLLFVQLQNKIICALQIGEIMIKSAIRNVGIIQGWKVSQFPAFNHEHRIFLRTLNFAEDFSVNLMIVNETRFHVYNLD